MSVTKARQGSVAGVAGGYAPLDSGLLVPAAYVGRMRSGTTALETDEGAFGWESTKKLVRLYDGQRERAISGVGWTPGAYPFHSDPGVAHNTALTLPANGGSVAIPIPVVGHMLLGDITVRNTDSTSARQWGWDLYINRMNSGTGTGSENTADRVAASNGDESYTASAASNRFLGAASQPVYLAPGLYWLVIQCTHSTNSFGVATVAINSSTVQSGMVSHMTKTTTNPNGDTLDLVAATWTKLTASIAVAMRGRVLGMNAVI